MGTVVPFSAARRDVKSKRPRLDECGRVLLFDGVRIERADDRLDLAARRGPSTDATCAGPLPGTIPGNH